MPQHCCNPNCSKGAYPDGHPLSGFCCARCVVKVFSKDDFERIGRPEVWYKPKQRGHYKHCCKSEPEPTQGRAKRPLLTSAWVDEFMAQWGKGFSTAAASSSPVKWEDASHARLLQDSQIRPAMVFLWRHVNMILDMPVVIISLTYEGSDDKPWMGLDEFKSVHFYGRAAKMEPECARKSAMSDGILPILDFMGDHQRDPDTRFIFLEKEWRPHTEDVMDPMSAKDVMHRMVQVAIATASHGMGDFVWMSWEQHR